MRKLILLNFTFYILHFTSAQNVGIGITNPAHPLNFPSTTGNKISLWGTGTNHYGFGIAPSLLQIYTMDNTNDIAFGYGNSNALTENMRIKGNGNVGIGTSSPIHKLSVAGGMNIDNNDLNTGTVANSLRFGGGNSGEAIGSRRTAGANQWGLDFYTNSAQRMSITLNGNIGIGTNTPSEKLEINGGLKLGYTSGNAMGSLRFHLGWFEGNNNGAGWLRLDQMPLGTMVATSVYPDINLEDAGYKYTSAIQDASVLEDVSSAAANSWMATAEKNSIIPDPRFNHTAVWSGTEMLVWGGNGNGGGSRSEIGYRYNPIANTWRKMTSSNAPEGRESHSAVWTGTEMIVWGGYTTDEVNDGGKYNPQTDIWNSMASVNAPAERINHTAVWTGTEMIVWGGTNISSTEINTGSKYNPATNTWSAVTTTNAPSARTKHTAIWTGSEMLIWGGLGTGNTELNTGAKYNTASNTWTTMNTTNAPSARYAHHAVWTGTEMIVWGGTSGDNSGGRYNPSTNTWTATSTTNAPVARESSSAVWNGTDMIIWGGSSGQFLNSGYKYNPGSNVWNPVSLTNAPAVRFEHTAVWSGANMIIWGGRSTGSVIVNSGGRYFPLLTFPYNTNIEKIAPLFFYRKL